jgi:hypothetical protein
MIYIKFGRAPGQANVHALFAPNECWEIIYNKNGSTFYGLP